MLIENGGHPVVTNGIPLLAPHICMIFIYSPGYFDTAQINPYSVQNIPGYYFNKDIL